MLDFLLALWIGRRAYRKFRDVVKYGLFNDDDAGLNLSYGHGCILIQTGFYVIVSVCFLAMNFTIAFLTLTILTILKFIGNHFGEEWYREANKE